MYIFKTNFLGDEDMKLEEKANLINQYIKEWFDLNNRIEAKPKELMDFLIEKEIYSRDNREGNPLRSDLRRLRDKNLLYLIDSVEAVTHGKITKWYFRKKL